MNGITIKASKYFIFLQVFLHSSAMIVIIMLDLFWWIKLIIVSFCLMNFFYVFHRYILLRSKKSVVKIWYNTKNEWYLLNRDGEKILGEICDDSIITNFLVILNFKILGRRRRISVVIFSDIIGKEDLRRLRVQLFNSR